jgi:8-amino-7-oxononanoate synthase
MSDITVSGKFKFMAAALQARQEAYQLRSLQTVFPCPPVQVIKQGRKLLNFSSNDYLGLSQHPALIQTAQQYLQEYGTGATASRLVSGTYPIHQQLEENLAQACGREAALVFNSGFQANSTVLASLLDRHSCVICDRLCHNSLLQGALASQAHLLRYHHNDLDHLESLLRKTRTAYQRLVIVSETVFSMDGDRSPITALVQLANQYEAMLYLDDAHAFGVMGPQGMGLAAGRPEVDLVVGTFGKAWGSFGAVVTSNSLTRDYLVNVCPGFIYTTALPPAIIGAIVAALELIPTLDVERQTLQHRAIELRQGLQQLGYDTGASASQIVPILVGSEAQTLHLSQWLEEHDILAIAIRPPTVPTGTSRIRIALSSQHTPAHIEQLLDVIHQWQKQI